MKKLIVVRHGAYGSDGHITAQGRLDIDGLAESISRSVDHPSVIKILSSTVTRAVDSAEHLSLRLKLGGIFLYGSLSTDHGTDLDGVIKLIEAWAPEVDVLVLMTHYEFCRDLIPQYATEKLGMHPSHRLLVDIAERNVGTGRGYSIDITDQKISRL